MKCHLFRNAQPHTYPRYSKNHISRTRTLVPTTSKKHGVNDFISLATLHKFTSCFSSGKQWRQEKVQTRNAYCPHCSNTGRNPSCCPLAVATGRAPTNTYSQAGSHGIFPKPVSVKQRINHWFLGTVCCNPASCATQQVVQAWGWHTHLRPGEGSSADLHSSTSTSHSSSSLLCTQTHSWLYIKYHSPYSNNVI